MDFHGWVIIGAYWMWIQTSEVFQLELYILVTIDSLA